MNIRDEQQQQEQAAKDKQLAMLEEQADFLAVANMPEGRRLLRRIIEECGVYKSTFTGDPLTMSYMEGKRMVGLMLLEQLLDSPLLFLKFLTEVNNGRRDGNNGD